MHAQTAAFRAAGRQRDYRDTIMVTALSPCWYCSGLVRQFRIGTIVVGEARTFVGGLHWLSEHRVRIIVLDDQRCVQLMREFIAARPQLWNEDIGSPVSTTCDGSLDRRSQAQPEIRYRCLRGHHDLCVCRRDDGWAAARLNYGNGYPVASASWPPSLGVDATGCPAPPADPPPSCLTQSHPVVRSAGGPRLPRF
jgi:hypothetical protein